MTRNLRAHVLAAAVMLSPAPLAAQESAATHTQASPQVFAGASYEYRSFFGDIDPWHLAVVELGRRAPASTIIARANHARRFGNDATQGELDAYPRLGARTYAYLNAGYGEEPLFPRWRFGAELFSVNRAGWEGSLGLRQLRFSGLPVTLYTGSVGRYAGNYWVSLRPWISSSRDANTGSMTITARRYTADAEHYVGVQVAAGRTPSDRVLLTDLSRTSSVSASLDGSGGPWSTTVLTWSVGAQHERLDYDRNRRSLVLSAGVRHRF